MTTKTWITSDCHLNHRQILKYCPHRIDASFTGDINTASEEEIDHLVQLMNERIISNWNSKVNPNDIVWIIGDVAMGRIINAPPLIRRLNGIKNLVKGNHDKTLCKLPEVNELFANIYDYKEISHKVDGQKHMINLSHYPIACWNGMNQGTLHLFGHRHGTPHGLTGRLMDIGMDTNNLFPYDLDDVVRELLKIELIRSHH